jgi:hypothetical protein
MQPGTMEAFYADLRHGSGVGVEEHANADENGSALLIFPNPGNGIIEITLPEDLKGQFNLTVHDAIGKLVFNEIRAVGPGGSRLPLDLQSLEAGMYMVGLRALDGSAERRGQLLIK